MNLDAYETLKRHLPEEAAKLIAEALPFSREVATKNDLEGLRAEMKLGFEQLRGEIHRMEARIYRWMLTYFGTLLLAVLGMIVTVVLKG